MTKDAEIEQVLSLPNEEWQRKKLRLPHSQKREAEKPQKRRSKEPTLLKDYRRFCQSESDVHGSETEIRGSECKNMGANVAIVTFAPTIPCFAQRNLLYSTSVINHAMNYGINNEESP